MHGPALQPAGTQDAHGRRPAGRGFRELEPDLLPALFPHAGRPPEPGGVSLAGTPRPLQGRPARTAGAAGRRSHVLRGFGAADAHAARKRISGGCSASKRRTTGARTTSRGSQATNTPSGWARSRPISSASTSFPSCNSPTAASPGAKRCATAPSRCSNACQPRTTVTCATGATRAL